MPDAEVKDNDRARVGERKQVAYYALGDQEPQTQADRIQALVQRVPLICYIVA